MKRQNLRTVSLIVVTFTYLLFGAAIFGWLESDHEQNQRRNLEFIEGLIRTKYNISDDDYTILTTTIIKSVPHRAGIQWKFSGALYFATTVLTTIGYGHSTPSTLWGRSFCMVYALIGIPLGLVMFQSIGERLNTFVGSALRHTKRCCRARNPEVTQTNLVMVVLVLSTILMTSMANVFAKYENWEYFDAFYYCFITLTTIGFGDYVALQKESALQSKPEYVALSLIFILFGLSVVSSAVNLLVLKFLTLNTEDERRDEQLRYTAALNPIQLEGDVITSSAGGLEYARTKRPALTLSQAMAGTALMSERQRRALVSAKLARSRPVLALKHSKLDLTQPIEPAATNQRRHQLRSSCSSPPHSSDSSCRRGPPRPDEMHIQNARHRAEDDEMRQVVGQRRQPTPASCDVEPDCDDNRQVELRRRRPLALSSGNVEAPPPWRRCNTNECRLSGDDKIEVEDGDSESEPEDSNLRHYCQFYNQNNNNNKNILNLPADESSCCHAHNRPACVANAACHRGRRTSNGSSVRYPGCSYDEPDPINCQAQHIVYVPSSQSFNQVHHDDHDHDHRQRPYYSPRGALQSHRQATGRYRASHNQLIPLEHAPFSTQLAAFRTNTSRRPTVPPRPPPDDGDADDEEHAPLPPPQPPIVELLMSAQSLDECSPPVLVDNAGQVFTYPDPTSPRDFGDSRRAPMNSRQRRANQQSDASTVSTLQLELRCRRHQQLAGPRPDIQPAQNELVRQIVDHPSSSGNQSAAGDYEPHQARDDDTRPMRRKIAPSQMGAALGANHSSCSCSWASLSAAVSPELIAASAAPARLQSSPLNPPDYPFHPALAATANVQTSRHSTIDRGRSYDRNSSGGGNGHGHGPQKSFFQSSPAVHEIDHRDEQRNLTEDEQATVEAAPRSFGQSPTLASLQTSPVQPASPTSTFDGGRPVSRRDRATKSSNFFTFIDNSKSGAAESSATVSTKARRLRRRSNENENRASLPKLVCKCCCQHAECIEYALSSEAKKQELDETNVISIQGNSKNRANTNKDDKENDLTAATAEVELEARHDGDADSNRSPSELATGGGGGGGSLITCAGDGLILNDQTQADSDPENKMISDQCTATTGATTGKMDQQQEDGTNKQ